MAKVKIPDYWTNEEVENILNSYLLISEKAENAVICPTLVLTNGSDSEELTAGLINRLDSNKQLLLIPVVNEDGHYSALIISKKNSECVYNDSSGNPMPGELRKALETIYDDVRDLKHQQQDNNPEHDNEQSAIAAINNLFNYVDKGGKSAIGGVSSRQVSSVMNGSLKIYRGLELKPREDLSPELAASNYQSLSQPYDGPSAHQYSNAWGDDGTSSFSSTKKEQSSSDLWYPERVEGTLRDYLRNEGKTATVYDTLDIGYSKPTGLWENLPELRSGSFLYFIPVINNNHYSAIMIEEQGMGAKCFYNDSSGNPMPTKLREALEIKYGDVEDLGHKQQDDNPEHDNEQSAIATINNCLNFAKLRAAGVGPVFGQSNVKSVMEGSLQIFNGFAQKYYPKREEGAIGFSEKPPLDDSRMRSEKATDYFYIPSLLPYNRPNPTDSSYDDKPPSYDSVASEKPENSGRFGVRIPSDSQSPAASVAATREKSEPSKLWAEKERSRRGSLSRSQSQNMPDLTNLQYQYANEDIDTILKTYIGERPALKNNTYLSPAIVITPQGAVATYIPSKKDLDNAIASALSGKIALIPVHLDGGHWAAMSIKRDNKGEININYANPFGVKIENSFQSELLANPLLQNNKVNIICDNKRAQDWNSVDCGPVTVDNLISLAEGKNDEQAINRKVSAADLRKEHQQILQRSNEIKKPAVKGYSRYS